MKKRFVSMLLVLTMVFGLCIPAFAADKNTVAGVSTSDIHAEGTNPLGTLLANEITTASEDSQRTQNISNLTVSGKPCLKVCLATSNEFLVLAYRSVLHCF